MKHILLLIVSALVLNATVYFSKLEPYEKYIISSEVSGKVVFVDKDLEYRYIKSKMPVVRLDTKDEKTQLDSLKKTLSIQEEFVEIKEQNYKNKHNVKQVSIYDKNQERTAWLEAKKSLENYKKDIKVQENSIGKKEFFVEEKYIDEIFVSPNEYVTSGSKLYTLYDFSQSKLEIYVIAKEIETLKNKEIFVDGKKSDYKIQKIASVRDSVKVSTYKVILGKKNKYKNIKFGKIVKVEFR